MRVIKGIIILDRNELMRYTTLHMVDALNYADLVLPFESLTLDENVRSIDLDRHKIIVRDEHDLIVVIIADKRADLDILEELAQKIHVLLGKYGYNERTGIFERSLCVEIKSIISLYERKLIGKCFKLLFRGRYSWINAKDLARLVEVILLGGKINDKRNKNDKRNDLYSVVDHFRRVIWRSCPFFYAEDAQDSGYYWKLDINKRKILTNAPGKLGREVGELLRKGQIEEIIRLAWNVCFTTFELKQAYINKITPVQLINIVEMKVRDIIPMKDHTLQFAAYIASSIFSDIRENGKEIENKILCGFLIKGF